MPLPPAPSKRAALLSAEAYRLKAAEDSADFSPQPVPATVRDSVPSSDAAPAVSPAATARADTRARTAPRGQRQPDTKPAPPSTAPVADQMTPAAAAGNIA